MNIFDEIAAALKIKLKKYRNTELSTAQLCRLEDMLLSEAVSEMIFSLKTMKTGADNGKGKI